VLARVVFPNPAPERRQNRVNRVGVIDRDATVVWVFSPGPRREPLLVQEQYYDLARQVGTALEGRSRSGAFFLGSIDGIRCSFGRVTVTRDTTISIGHNHDDPGCG
jgi:hypothetical protein